MNSKEDRCSKCWLKDNVGCSDRCEFKNMSSDQFEVGMNHISMRNDIDLMQFIFMFVIPVYEEVTGNKDTMKQIGKAFKRRWKAEKGSIDGLPNYL